jgi:3-oxoacyl-[acyl-carrier protein] reductase
VLAGEGVRTVLAARRAHLLEQLAEEIERAGGLAPVVAVADLTAPEGPAAVARVALEACGRVDILVNNAGGSRPLPLDATEAQWDEAMALNFTSVRRLTHALLPPMQRQRHGRIVNITGSLEPRAVNGANAAKAAVLLWAKGLSCEVAAQGITVNCIGPGRIHSEQIDHRLHPTPESQAAFVAAHIPAGYFGEPEDVAWAVAFLGSDKARYITGQSFYVDGGMHRSI